VSGESSVWLWAALYALAGLLALSCEIVWFRLLGVMIKSSAFTFGTVLAFYLAGLGIGAVAGSRYLPRVRRPALAFLGLQAAAGLAGVLFISTLVALADDIGALRGYFASYEPLSVADSVAALRSGGLPSNFLRMYIGAPLVLVLPPTLLFGASFPFLQAVVQTDLAHVGRRVGALLVANILGSMSGAMLTGWLLLDALGSAGTLRLLAVGTGVFVLGAAYRWTGRALAAAAITAVVTTGAIAVTPAADVLWARLHGTDVERLVVAEDGSGVSAIATAPEGLQQPAVVFSNGLGQSVIPYGDVHTALGVLPAFVHPEPREALIIGLGSGDTLYAAAGRSTLTRVTNVEIIASQRDTLSAFADRHGYPAVRALLADRRVEFVSGDGRAHLMRTPRRFDLIEADALRPGSAYSGTLYSDAYFTLLRDRLRPGGIAATWAPTRRVHNAFVRVFPHVVSLPGILLGSTTPIGVDRATIAARLEAADVRAYFGRAGIDIVALITPYLAAPVAYGPDFDRSALTDVNTDLFPRDEFDLGN
jgi:predicted membrane-bound spermidine synthase